ncbi:unnamed protein product [Brassica napus]|uniref:(rape) hypothetical protein n=1 Tax=Brassica napus TaxID=3708 RepID=A0A816U840_BRANA|nr:unnamed protein product [Brassica napus]
MSKLGNTLRSRLVIYLLVLPLRVSAAAEEENDFSCSVPAKEEWRIWSFYREIQHHSDITIPRRTREAWGQGLDSKPGTCNNYPSIARRISSKTLHLKGKV